MVYLLAIPLLLLLACGDSGNGGTIKSEETVKPTETGKYIITFYGVPDNDPPGSRAIAFPKNNGFPASIHNEAGGIGTFEDPITTASRKDLFPIGTRIYIPDFKKYVVIEDTCASCEGLWIDVWMESTTSFPDELKTCQEKWTRWTDNPAEIEIDPPPGRAVDTTAFFDTTNGRCR